jgi:hypothetical protein
MDDTVASVQNGCEVAGRLVSAPEDLTSTVGGGTATLGERVVINSLAGDVTGCTIKGVTMALEADKSLSPSAGANELAADGARFQMPTTGVPPRPKS